MGVEKRRKRLLLFAILAATITYQAGLTPPGGFVYPGPGQANLTAQAGGPVPILLHNFPRRYKAFFYCNSLSFMLSIALIMLMVNSNLYKPAIRSGALSVCTATGLFALIGAYAAGSTQHKRASIRIIVLASAFSLTLFSLILVFLLKELSKRNGAGHPSPDGTTAPPLDRSTGHQNGVAGGHPPAGPAEAHPGAADKRKKHAKRKYLMLLGILVASVTYQAGLHPPGGVWQSNAAAAGHRAGDPVMHDNRRRRYRAFYYSNSVSMVASIVVIVLLLLPKKWQRDEELWFKAMNTAVLLDLVALLGAYATGSSRDRETSWYVAALVLAVLGYIAIHLVVSYLCTPRADSDQGGS